jgi:antitoxin CptB
VVRGIFPKKDIACMEYPFGASPISISTLPPNMCFSSILAIASAKVYNISMNLLKKLIYQSWHRGTRENDLLLGPFADAVLPNLSETDLKAYQDMLDHEDADLFAWITGQYPIPENEPMIRCVRDFHQCR